LRAADHDPAHVVIEALVVVDSMALAKIEAIIAAVRQERYRWRPVRRVVIEKRHSTKKRPLGLPSWSDKLLQEVVRSLLNAYYEPQFSQCSHGFRPGRGCHTALTAIHETWKGTVWFIEGDIAACFTSLDHEILLATLAEQIHDSRFLRLVAQLLKAGYLEDWRSHPTLSGVPQGAVASPVLSNVYLNRLDQFVETVLLPQYNRGARRKANSAYGHLQNQAYRLEHAGQYQAARPLRQRQWALPSSDTHAPDFRRLHYVRYADDVRHITRRQIPFTERRGSEDMTPGSTTYLEAKAEGDNSMSLKRRTSEGVYGAALQDPRDTVRATLPKPQFPAMEAYIPCPQRLLAGAP
jgi:group II intron reverse transcriptase/maturase